MHSRYHVLFTSYLFLKFFCWQKLITVIYIVDIRRPVMISIYIFLKHAKNVVSSVPWNSLHSSGLYFHEIQTNFSKSKIFLIYTKKKLLYSFLRESTCIWIQKWKSYIILFWQKNWDYHFLYSFAKKYFQRTFQEMSSFLIITQKRRHFSRFFPRELGRYTYLGTLLKVDYAD